LLWQLHQDPFREVAQEVTRSLTHRDLSQADALVVILPQARTFNWSELPLTPNFVLPSPAHGSNHAGDFLAAGAGT